ncbi:MAG: cysteine peptidase family C39 domain-containing protein [Muribaculum sp.]|nr:cysteine peptidase family C39 domain-containing protein [Muribaculum sp.]
MNNRTLFSDYLSFLNIPHTTVYSSERFTAYPPKLALVGIADLLHEYGADVVRTKAGEDKKLDDFIGPFVAQLGDGHYVIVTKVDDSGVTYQSKSLKVITVPKNEFLERWNGASVIGKRTERSEETQYLEHKLGCLAKSFEKWFVIACVVFFVVYGYVNNRLYDSMATMILPFLYGFGVYICYLLVLKQSHVQSDAADSVCGIIQKNGCGTVLDTSAAKLFGLFPWCEIGLAYFSVSEIAILLYPQCVNYLAIIGVCCLPYTFWSVLYQKFKIHAWCTLCLTIQSLMWIIFFVFLFGGEFKNLLPIRIDALILLMAYGCALFIFNWLIPIIFKYELSGNESEGRSFVQ